MVLSSPERIRRLFGYPEQPNFRRATTSPRRSRCRSCASSTAGANSRWCAGADPPWVKDPRAFTLLINARGESVNDKPAFRNAMWRRRCLFPPTGSTNGRSRAAKRPFCVRPRDGEPIAFAGLWETWIGPNGEEMETAAIVTTNANRELRRCTSACRWCRPRPSISGSTAARSTP